MNDPAELLRVAQDAATALDRLLDLIPPRSHTTWKRNHLYHALQVCEDLVKPVS